MAKKIKSIVYGEGGFDDTKPKNNVIKTEYFTDEELALEAEAKAKVDARALILERLGLTADELKTILG
jgi:hypothetical protein